MLEFLQTGKALSVLAVIVLAGTLSKLITRSLYRRLLKDTENMAMTRNKNLTVLKQKLENTYRVNQNVVNSKAYLDKLMYEFRFLHVSLDAWDQVSRQMALLGILAGGVGSFLSYHYRIESYYMVLYASVGAMGGLFLLFVESSFRIEQKKQKLETILLEYVDNSVFVRAARETAARDFTAKEGVLRELPLREDGVGENGLREPLPRRSRVRSMKERNSKAEELLRTVRGMKEKEDSGPESPARREIESLRESMEQIAASRDKTKEEAILKKNESGGRDWTKSISEEEMKLIGEVMREYFTRKGEV